LADLSLVAISKKILPGLEISVKQYLSLIPKSAQLAAVRATPVYGVAGHAPQIFHHALLAYLKTAATGPAEGKFLPADVAAILFLPFPFGSWSAV
jgi:hypothetical protein